MATKFQGLIGKIDLAVEILDLYQVECEKRALRLLYPHCAADCPV